MRKSPSVIVGLDIGSSMMRVVVVAIGPLGPRLLAAEEAVRPAGIAAGQRELRALVRRVELCAGVSIRDVTIGVGTGSPAVHTFQQPAQSQSTVVLSPTSGAPPVAPAASVAPVAPMEGQTWNRLWHWLRMFVARLRSRWGNSVGADHSIEEDAEERFFEGYAPNGIGVSDADKATSPRKEQSSFASVIASLPPERVLLQVLPCSSDDEGCERLAISVDRAAVSSGLRFVEGAGVRVREVVLDSYAAMLGTIGDKMPQGIVVVGVLGARTTACIVVQDGVVRRLEERMQGGDRATNALAAHLRIDLGEAERLKRGIDLDPTDNERPVIANLLATHLRDRLTFVRETTESAVVKNDCAVLLTGGGAQAAGLRRLASEILQRPIVSDSVLAFPGRERAVRCADGWSTAVGLVRFALRRDDGLEITPSLLSDMRNTSAVPSASAAVFKDKDGGRATVIPNGVRATIIPRDDGFAIGIDGQLQRKFPPSHRGLLLAARYIEKFSRKPRRVERITPADFDSLLDGRHIDVRGQVSPVPIAILAALRAEALQRCPHLQTGEDAVRRHGPAPVIYAADTYANFKLMEDITRFEAAAWFAVLAPSCRALHGWRRAFSAVGDDMRARNVSLERFPTRPDALWQLRHLRLVRPVESELHLDILVAATRAGVAPSWLTALQWATERGLNTALEAVNVDVGDRPGAVGGPRVIGTGLSALLMANRTQTPIVRLVRALARIEPDVAAGSATAGSGGLVRAAVQGARLLRGAPVVRSLGSPRWSPPSAPGVRLITTDVELVEEGQRMHHCVANRVPRALRGASFVFHVDHEGEQATVELDADGDLVAVFGFANEVDTPACRHARGIFTGWRRPQLVQNLVAARARFDDLLDLRLAEGGPLASIDSIRGRSTRAGVVTSQPPQSNDIAVRCALVRALIDAARGDACGDEQETLAALREAHQRLFLVVNEAHEPEHDDGGGGIRSLNPSGTGGESFLDIERLFVEVCDELALVVGDGVGATRLRIAGTRRFNYLEVHSVDSTSLRIAAVDALRRIVRSDDTDAIAHLRLGQRLADDAFGKNRIKGRFTVALLQEAAPHLETATRAYPGLTGPLWTLSCVHDFLGRWKSVEGTQAAFHASAEFNVLMRMAHEAEEGSRWFAAAADCCEKWAELESTSPSDSTMWLVRLVFVAEHLVKATSNNPDSAEHTRARRRLTEARVQLAERQRRHL
jgi:cell division ATPase FtsA